MRLPSRQQSTAVLPGVEGVARVERRTRVLLPRLHPGDIAVLDHPALDRATAQALVDAGVAAVLNAAPMVSERYPNLGPEILAAAGIAMVDRLGTEALGAVRDGTSVRLDGARLYAGEQLLAEGRRLERPELEAELALARRGLATQLEAFTHNSTELLRREEDLLLHGRGVPALTTRTADKTVLVVVPGHDHEAELRAIRAYLREQQPVLVAVGRAADTLREAGHTAHVIVVDAADGAQLPSAKALRAAGDVVVRTDRGTAGKETVESLDRLGVRPVRLESGVTAEDAALVLADAGDAAVVIGVGMSATLEDFLDRGRPGLASTYLARLKLGPRLVDAAAVPYLYSGRVRPHHLLLVMIAGLVALAAAVGVTPVGQEWADQISETLRGLLP